MGLAFNGSLQNIKLQLKAFYCTKSAAYLSTHKIMLVSGLQTLHCLVSQYTQKRFTISARDRMLFIEEACAAVSSSQQS